VVAQSEMSEAPVIFFTGAFLFVRPLMAIVTAPGILQSNDIDIHDEPLYISLIKDEISRTY
jgi:hypothetical protein